MRRSRLPVSGAILGLFLLLGLMVGCGSSGRSYALNQELARSSVQTAMQAWVDGKSPKDLKGFKPAIIIGDTGWEKGKKLVSFEILANEETSDGSNLHIRVKRKFSGEGGDSESKVIYIVGTTPVITIFPQ